MRSHWNALHEAGHAVMADLVGYRVDSVTIEVDGDTSHGNVAWAVREDVGPMRVDRIKYNENAALIYIAGPVVSCRIMGYRLRDYLKGPDQRYEGSDAEYFAYHINEVALDTGETTREVRNRLAKLARKLVLDKGLNEDRVSRLASLLMDKGTLTGQEVTEHFGQP